SNPTGNANGIQARLQVDGGPIDLENDTLDVEDTADNVASMGVLSSTDLMGIFGAGGSIGYGDLELLTLRLGNGGNTFTVASTHGSATHIATTTAWIGNGDNIVNVKEIDGPTTITTGLGNDTFKVGSDAAAS